MERIKFLTRILLICIMGFGLLSSCQTSKPASSTEEAQFAGYKHVKYSFYTDSTGRLYERKSTFDGKNEGTAFAPEIRMWSKDSSWYVELGSVLDIATYEHIRACDFSRDKNHVYYFFGMSDGGFRRIVAGADPITFQCFGSGYRWGKDTHKVYYMYDSLSELNASTAFFLHNIKTPNDLSDYVSDGRVIYYTNDKLDSVDVPSFKIIDSAGYTARDKNFLYQGRWRKKI